MNLSAYQSAAQSNADVLRYCLKNRSTELSQIIFWEGVTGKDLAFDQVLARSYDILACCAIGAVPSISPRGADGFFFKSGQDQPLEIETKLTGIESKNIYIGSRGGLYWSSDPNNYHNKAAITSYFQGVFDSSMTNETMHSKKRYTALVCFDRDTNSVIDAWLMSPENILNEIKQRRSNKTISIKLNRFMEKGTKILTTVDCIGWKNWTKTQAKLAKENKRFR